ncbi:hypothetical protein JCM33374_g5141 [Metschnikowia sp. JCM 33374]|nr:hypothetical protein JCM33374_g5141 [Metschnikowia sp. JCM 33374]
MNVNPHLQCPAATAPTELPATGAVASNDPITDATMAAFLNRDTANPAMQQQQQQQHQQNQRQQTQQTPQQQHMHMHYRSNHNSHTRCLSSGGVELQHRVRVQRVARSFINDKTQNVFISIHQEIPGILGHGA